MGESTIYFNVSEKLKQNIIHAKTSDNMRNADGQIQIKIDGKDITKGSITLDSGEQHNLTVGNDRIVPFASKLLDALPEILEGREDGEPTTREYGPWEFHFKRKEDNINCSIFWLPDEVFMHENQIISVKEYCTALLQVSKNLGDLMLQNDLCKTFVVYNNEFEPARRLAIKTIFSKKLLSQEELEKIFSKEYINKVIYEEKRVLNNVSTIETGDGSLFHL